MTLKVRVRDDRRALISGLKAENFEVKTTAADRKEFQYSLTSPEMEIAPPDRVRPDPAYLIILLDMSGSMKNRDRSGRVKLQGAIEGIQKFLETIETQKLPAEIALVPFGEGCANAYRVDRETLQKSLEPAPYTGTKDRLDELAKTEVCASTNLYQPLDEAIDFLATSERFQTESSGTPPRLSVILFTDGFDADPDRDSEARRFQDTLDLLARFPRITVHTMGYGEPLDRLRARAHCRPDIDRQPLTVNNLLKYCKLPSGEDIREFIVDRDRLTAIARGTKEGIDRFPRSAAEVSRDLVEFLTALREYEITYRQPTADRATLHRAKVIVNAPDRGISSLVSEPHEFRLPNFLYRTLSVPERVAIFLGTIAAAAFGTRRFRAWSQQLKEQSRRNLQG
ncbi:vWA domain-containing protein [Pannus brasiliensis CCIBt3594]|uniref:VWA domain-containing protein n=1 Tax=Pannus brasiliensis CCIBt3594 TaxID=1427578 RepID=A0AAW9QMN3_9CHRO